MQARQQEQSIDYEKARAVFLDSVRFDEVLFRRYVNLTGPQLMANREFKNYLATKNGVPET